MAKKVLIFSLLVVFIFLLGGCATTRKQSDLENQGLKNQISVLEAQIQSKDEEINSLKEALNKAMTEKGLLTGQKEKIKAVEEAKSKPTAKHVQIALRNAGYDPGKIDGKIGRQTKVALKAFQKANSLAVTGKADRETWNVLKGHLEKKVK